MSEHEATMNQIRATPSLDDGVVAQPRGYTVTPAKLRAAAADWKVDGHAIGVRHLSKMANEAADEIERLQAEVAALQAGADATAEEKWDTPQSR